MYCVGCKKNIANKNSSVKRTKQNKSVLVSNCAFCGNKNLIFIKNQEASRLLSQLGIKIPLSKIPLIGNTLFQG